MQLHTLKATHRGRRGRRIGRGGKRGTYSGKGVKGQKSRAGAKIRPAIRDYIKSIPKLRGEEFPALPGREKAQILHLADLREAFSEGSLVTPKTLVTAGLLISAKDAVKLLGDGEPPEKLVVRGVAVSHSAREKIVQRGGKVE
ncbi:MAG: uL15 family ribosomal protein [Candidatus Terrybacteria bacterium]|nr:uL15 family ribosomal protein [Candidatus Terrybacteria bacterium]